MDPANPAMPKNAYELAGDVKEPVLGLYGADDTGITPDQVERMKAALQAAGKTSVFKIYPGALHGFSRIIGRAIAKKQLKMRGVKCKAGSKPWRLEPVDWLPCSTRRPVMTA